MNQAAAGHYSVATVQPLRSATSAARFRLTTGLDSPIYASSHEELVTHLNAFGSKDPGKPLYVLLEKSNRPRDLQAMSITLKNLKMHNSSLFLSLESPDVMTRFGDTMSGSVFLQSADPGTEVSNYRVQTTSSGGVESSVRLRSLNDGIATLRITADAKHLIDAFVNALRTMLAQVATMGQPSYAALVKEAVALVAKDLLMSDAEVKAKLDVSLRETRLVEETVTQELSHTIAAL